MQCIPVITVIQVVLQFFSSGSLSPLARERAPFGPRPVFVAATRLRSGSIVYEELGITVIIQLRFGAPPKETIERRMRRPVFVMEEDDNG